MVRIQGFIFGKKCIFGFEFTMGAENGITQ